MVSIKASKDSSKITIFGHGLSLDKPFQFSPDVKLHSHIVPLDLDTTVAGCETFTDYAAALQGSECATFAIEISETAGLQQLVVKSWNALWLFHLLSVSCRTPCLILYSMSDGKEPTYSATTRTPFIRKLAGTHTAKNQELEWAVRHFDAFSALIDVPEFSSAMRCYGNAHYLLDADVKLMLLWAGIEGLLSVDAELSRRLALYAAIILDGTSNEKIAYFEEVKSAYSLRSRAVHGNTLKPRQLENGCIQAGQILIRLLARCIELGRVPSPKELDSLAVGSSIR